jgi:hypothetical protein
MNIREYHLFFVTVVAIVALLVASPALSRLLVYPRTEFFTEMGLLGPNHMAEAYPHNITRGQTYSVYLGLANHLGYSAYYVVEVKFRNETQSMPSSFGPIENRIPSSLPSLYNISAFVADQSTWEMPLTFSFDYSNVTVSLWTFQNATVVRNATTGLIKNVTVTTVTDLPVSTLHMYNVTLNGVPLAIKDCSISNYAVTRTSLENGTSLMTVYSLGKGFFGHLFFETWIYNSTTSVFQYHARFVSLRLNMTGP